MNTQVLDNVDTGTDLSSDTGNAASADGQADGGNNASDQSTVAGAGNDAIAGNGASADTGGNGGTGAQARGAVRQDTVPHAALHEAREQVKALRSQIAALETQPKLTSDDADLLKELRQQRQTQQEADPDFLADPKGYVDSKLSRALKKLEANEQATTQTREQLQQQDQLRGLMNTVQAQEQAFTVTTPDYAQALQHLRSVRTEQLKLLYPSATDAQVAQTISREEITGAAQAVQSGMNPAEVVYKYAKTLGYGAKAAPKANGGIGDAPAIPAPDRSAARTLGSGGGSAGTQDATETEDSMPEFTAAIKERFGMARRR